MTCLYPTARCTVTGFLFCILIGCLITSCIESPGTSPVPAEFTRVSTLAGNDSSGFVDATGLMARFNHPSAMAIDQAGNIYVSDRDNHCIRKVTPDGKVTTFAGTGQAGADDGHRLSASFNNPYGLALDAKGNLYVGDVSNHSIRKISVNGNVTTLAGGRRGFSDRKGELAMFDHPHGVAVDAKSNVYVADSHNNRIRKVAPDGTTSTLAGNGNDGFVDGRGKEAEFYVPIGIVIDAGGNLYVGDEGNSSIRKIRPDGKVATLAGNGKFSFSDGVGQQATFNAPGGLAIDKTGNLYVADYLNNAIRRVSTSGEVRTIAGKLSKGFADGDPSEALFYYPFGIAVNGDGVVYVGDYYNHRIRKIE